MVLRNSHEADQRGKGQKVNQREKGETNVFTSLQFSCSLAIA